MSLTSGVVVVCLRSRELNVKTKSGLLPKFRDWLLSSGACLHHAQCATPPMKIGYSRCPRNRPSLAYMFFTRDRGYCTASTCLACARALA